MSNSTTIQIIIGLALLLVLGQSAYTVSETEQVILTQFGEPVGDPVVSPGLHFKIPFIQRTNVFEKRFLEWDGSPNQVPTKDKRFIWVDTYARWRITDPLLFFQRLRDERGAQSRLDDILDGETRNAVARHDLIELVRSTNRDAADVPIESEEEAVILEVIERGRQEITREILDTAADRTADLGIELLDLRLKRINYVEEVQQDVFARMIAERQRIAEQFRSEGQGESARIHGERERELAQISPRRIARRKSCAARPTRKQPGSTPKRTTATATSTRSRSHWKPTSRRWMPRRFSSSAPTASCSGSWSRPGKTRSSTTPARVARSRTRHERGIFVHFCLARALLTTVSMNSIPRSPSSTVGKSSASGSGSSPSKRARIVSQTLT